MIYKLYNITEGGLLNAQYLYECTDDSFEKAYERFKIQIIKDINKETTDYNYKRLRFKGLNKENSIMLKEPFRYFECNLLYYYVYLIKKYKYIIIETK